MLSIPDGIKLADVKKVLQSVTVLHHGRRKKLKKRSPLPAELRELRSLPWGTSICGYSLAEKISGGEKTGTLCLRLYVRRKVSESRIAAERVIPPYLTIKKGRERLRLQTDVVAMLNDPVAQLALEASSSIGSFTGVTDGTLALAVIDRWDRPFGLTCSHVALPWYRREPVMNPRGDGIESPPDTDGEPGPNTVGSLFTWTPLTPDTLHLCDAALFQPRPGVELSNRPLQLTPTSAFATSPLTDYLNNPRGRVQTYTRRKVLNGTIQSVQNSFSMTFLGKPFYFEEAVEVLYDEPTFGGDSGAVVIQADSREVLGLHFSAFVGTGTGYFIPAHAVRSAFRNFGLRLLS